jgi:hypothetical protein
VEAPVQSTPSSNTKRRASVLFGASNAKSLTSQFVKPIRMASSPTRKGPGLVASFSVWLPFEESRRLVASIARLGALG